jgi:hypothetical protein
VIADVAGALRDHWRALLLAGLIVFGPLGVLELLDNQLQEPLADDDLGDIDPRLLAAVIAAAFGHATAILLGEVVYAGIVAATVTAGAGGGGRPPLRELLRHLPRGRLIVGDLLWIMIVAVGLLALVVPGLVFIVWFALVAPAVEIEGQTVRGAFRRSRELVRRRRRLVAGFVVPIVLLSGVAEDAASRLSEWALGHGLAGEWVGSVLGNLLVAPIYALVAVYLFLGLRDYPSKAQTASV